jgi:hypothetical protein
MKAPKMKNKRSVVGLTALLLIVLAYSTSGNYASTALPAVNAPQNEALDFTIVNKTGYKIKALYIGASGTGDWAKEDEVLKGRSFDNGQALDIVFNPRAKAEKWDIMVTWADGDGSEEWLNLKLTEITKVTLTYDKENDVTKAIIE